MDDAIPEPLAAAIFWNLAQDVLRARLCLAGTRVIRDHSQAMTPEEARRILNDAEAFLDEDCETAEAYARACNMDLEAARLWYDRMADAPASELSERRIGIARLFRNRADGLTKGATMRPTLTQLNAVRDALGKPPGHLTRYEWVVRPTLLQVHLYDREPVVVDLVRKVIVKDRPEPQARPFCERCMKALKGPARKMGKCRECREAEAA